MRHSLRYLIVVLSLASSFAVAQCSKISPDELMNPAYRLFVFERLWITVDREYIYDGFGGVNWDEAHKEYRKAALSVNDNAEFYDLLADMVAELRDDHSSYLAPWESCEEDSFHAGELVDVVPNYLPIVSRLEDYPDVLHIDIPSFDSAQVPDVLEEQLDLALEEDNEVSAIVIDMRHNYGGYLSSAFKVLGQFTSGKLGYQYVKRGQYPVVQRKGSHYSELEDVPIVVLLDNHTHSAAEITAGILQAERGALVVGETPSAGNTEMLLPFDYRDGSRLWLAVGGFTLENGHNFESVGVIPDVTVDDVLVGLDLVNDDLVMTKALEALGVIFPIQADANITQVQ